jgi:pyrroline-5-carboxylate reductase
VKLQALKKALPQARIARVMPNLPSYLNVGVIAYYLDNLAAEQESRGLETTLLDLFEPLGLVQKVKSEDEINALTVACASGTGFVLELMVYLKEWLEEYDLSPEICRALAVQTFAGAASLALDQKKIPLEDLITRVASKKGTTEAGLSSMREFEIERALRYSLEKALLRAQELARPSN